MTSPRIPVLSSAHRIFVLSRAFLRIGIIEVISYPMGFVTNQLASFGTIVLFYFVSGFVDKGGAFSGDAGAKVGYDYFTFVAIGYASVRFLAAGLKDLSIQFQNAIQAGYFEMLLVEPIHWHFLPVGLVQWPTLQAASMGTLTFALSITMGASYAFSGIPSAILLLALGVLATLAIGILASSIKILSKRSDPIATIYQMAATTFGAVVVPVEHFPEQVRWISYLLPHTYTISGLRRVLMPQGDQLTGPTVSESIFALTAFCLILYPIAFWMFGRSLSYARKAGLLGGY